MAGNTSQPGATVVSRAMAVLGAFDDRHRALTLSEIGRRTGLPLTTTYRLVRELVAQGALTSDTTGSGSYVIGQRMWTLGLLAPVQTGLREVASPFLNDLHAATFATVHLAVRDGEQVLYLDRLSGNRSVPVVSTIGSRLPLHATGVGKVLLAHAPEPVRAAVLDDLQRITSFTITQPSRLSHQLTKVLENDYATTAEEMSLGACSVAVPVRQADRVVAALGIVVASLRRDRARLISALRVAAYGIGRSLPEVPH